jgi:hypothetical protein
MTRVRRRRTGHARATRRGTPAGAASVTRHEGHKVGVPSASGLVWLAVLGVTALFQVYRGAVFDAALFGCATVGLVILEARGDSHPRPGTSRVVRRVTSISLTSGALLLVLPVPLVLKQVALLMIAAVSAVGVLAVARPAASPAPPRTAALHRTEACWAGVLVLICLWEVTAFFLASPGPVAAYDHPTISALVEPLVASELGRILFVAVWLLVGWALLARGAVKPCAN